jgi:DNA modification methylase
MKKTDFIQGDCFETLRKTDQKFDLILTSIPDMFEINMKLEDYQDTFLIKVVELVSSSIKDKGFVILCQTDRKYKGTIFPKHMYMTQAMLSNGFILKDYKILLRSNLECMDQFRLIFSHILFFTKSGKFKKDLEPDMKRHIIVSKFPTNKNFWREDFPSLMIRNLTNEGEIVLDPFAGRGTVLKCARDLNRQYLGFEIDEQIYKEGVEYMGR